jgi:hypothetical protein
MEILTTRLDLGRHLCAAHLLDSSPWFLLAREAKVAEDHKVCSGLAMSLNLSLLSLRLLGRSTVPVGYLRACSERAYIAASLLGHAVANGDGMDGQASAPRIVWHLDREPSKCHILMQHWSIQIACDLVVVNPKMITRRSALTGRFRGPGRQG